MKADRSLCISGYIYNHKTELDFTLENYFNCFDSWDYENIYIDTYKTARGKVLPIAQKKQRLRDYLLVFLLQPQLK